MHTAACSIDFFCWLLRETLNAGAGLGNCLKKQFTAGIKSKVRAILRERKVPSSCPGHKSSCSRVAGFWTSLLKKAGPGSNRASAILPCAPNLPMKEGPNWGMAGPGGTPTGHTRTKCNLDWQQTRSGALELRDLNGRSEQGTRHKARAKGKLCRRFPNPLQGLFAWGAGRFYRETWGRSSLFSLFATMRFGCAFVKAKHPNQRLNRVLV